MMLLMCDSTASLSSSPSSPKKESVNRPLQGFFCDLRKSLLQQHPPSSSTASSSSSPSPPSSSEGQTISIIVAEDRAKGLCRKHSRTMLGRKKKEARILLPDQHPSHGYTIHSEGVLTPVTRGQLLGGMSSTTLSCLQELPERKNNPDVAAGAAPMSPSTNATLVLKRSEKSSLEQSSSCKVPSPSASSSLSEIIVDFPQTAAVPRGASTTATANLDRCISPPPPLDHPVPVLKQHDQQPKCVDEEEQEQVFSVDWWSKLDAILR